MEIYYESHILDKQITVESIKKDIANIEKDKEITLATIDKDTKSIVLETRNKDIEYVKLQKNIN